jgi:hypothetical protein
VCTLISKVRIATSKILRRCSWGGVPQAYPTLKKGGCKDYTSEEQWNSRLKRSQPSQHGPEGAETETGVIIDLSKICVRPLFY